MDNKQDRRIRKTRSLLRKGLTELMQSKRVKDITVREIADLCDINRGTFYLHYKDIYDMVEQIECELFQQFDDIMQDFTPDKIGANPREPLLKLFTFLRDNADMAKVLLGENGDLAFVNHLKDAVRERCMNAWIYLHPANATTYIPYYASYTISGCVGLIESWMDRDLAEAPEEMARLTEEMIRGTLGAPTRKQLG